MLATRLLDTVDMAAIDSHMCCKCHGRVTLSGSITAIIIQLYAVNRPNCAWADTGGGGGGGGGGAKDESDHSK